MIALKVDVKKATPKGQDGGYGFGRGRGGWGNGPQRGGRGRYLILFSISCIYLHHLLGYTLIQPF